MKPSRLWLVACLACAPACERGSRAQAQTQAESQAELDAGALRASAIDGLAAAAQDPVIIAELGVVAALAQPDVEVAVERLLARVGADPDLAVVSDRLFADVQEGPAMRASLAEFARANPKLDLSALTEGFVAHVDARLTRPVIAEAIEATLRSELRGADPALARAMLVEARAAELLATAIIVSFADAKVRAELERRLGKDPAALQERLGKRLAEPGRVGYLVGQLGEQLRSEPGTLVLVAIVDHEQTAKLLAGALARALDDAAVRERCEALFGLALAEELDAREFERELGRLLAEPAVVREATALLAAVGREDYVREQVAGLVARIIAAPGFSEGVVEALSGS